MAHIPESKKYVVFRNRKDGGLFFSQAGKDRTYREDWYELVTTTDDPERAQEVCTYSPTHGAHGFGIALMAKRGDSHCQKMIQNKGKPIPASLLEGD